MSTTHDPAAPAETRLLRLRKHGRALVLPVLVMIALVGAAGFFVGNLPEPWMNWAAIAAAIVLFLLLGIGPVLGWLSDRVIITDRRVILRRGFFVHRRSEMPLGRVREVRSKRGPIQRLFGSGDIDLLVNPEGSLRIRDVPGPRTVAEALNQLIESNYLRESAVARPPAMQPSYAGPSPVSPGARPVGHAETTVLPY